MRATDDENACEGRRWRERLPGPHPEPCCRALYASRPPDRRRVLSRGIAFRMQSHARAPARAPPTAIEARRVGRRVSHRTRALTPRTGCVVSECVVNARMRERPKGGMHSPHQPAQAPQQESWPPQSPPPPLSQSQRRQQVRLRWVEQLPALQYSQPQPLPTPRALQARTRQERWPLTKLFPKVPLSRRRE